MAREAIRLGKETAKQVIRIVRTTNRKCLPLLREYIADELASSTNLDGQFLRILLAELNKP